jgi:hypothetical protein
MHWPRTAEIRAGKCAVAARGLPSRGDRRNPGCRHPLNSIIGTFAAWTLGYGPFVFAGSQRLAADFALRLLAGQLPAGERRRALQARQALPQEVSEPGALSSADAQTQEGDCAPPF